MSVAASSLPEVDALLARGERLVKRGYGARGDERPRYEEARFLARQALAVDPRSARARLLLSEIGARTGDLEAAFREARRGLRTDAGRWTFRLCQALAGSAVLLGRPQQALATLRRAAKTTGDERVERFSRRYSSACEQVGDREANVRTRQLKDNTVGYYVRFPRTDDCFAAALATVLQVPIEDVPDPRLDERLGAGESIETISDSTWLELAAWLDERGLRMVVHWTIPPRRRRWIGVVPMRGAFNDHCLVMSNDQVLFDPARSSSRRLARFGLDDVGLGLSFVTTNERPRGQNSHA